MPHRGDHHGESRMESSMNPNVWYPTIAAARNPRKPGSTTLNS